MATDALPEMEEGAPRVSAGLFSGRRGRALRDNLTAYLFLLPGMIIIFVFGIFPVFYAGYVSLYRWRIKQGEFRGLANFVTAMGDVAYTFFFVIALALAVVALTTGYKAYRTSRSKDIPPYFLAASLLPGAFLTGGLAMLILRAVTFFAQEEAIERGDAQILGSVPIGVLLVVLGVIASTLINRWQHSVAARSRYQVLPSFTGPAVIFVFAGGAAVALAIFTRTELQGSEGYGLALIRTYIMAGGVGLLGLAYGVWRWAMNQFSTRRAIVGLFGAAMLIGLGLYFSTFWPIVSENADPRFYQSLIVTVFFSAGTVPIQLAIAVLLAYLLFQDIRFKGLFRVVYFIPYMAPSVAAAGIFQVMFSQRVDSIANNVMTWMTGLVGDPTSLKWLGESKEALAVIGQAFGIEGAASWNYGPSLALVVIILYSIWVYVGYNTVIFLAGLGNIPGTLYEAAEIDGAGRWALFRHVTLPLLSPITFFLSVLAVIGTFKAFNSIWVLRDSSQLGTTDTASIYFFETFFRGTRFGYATSMAIILFVIILTLTLIQNQVAERRVHYG